MAFRMAARPHVTNCRCERWQTPDGEMVTAPLPGGIDGHFGSELRRFVLAQYHQGQMTVPRLATLLCDIGIFISKRQVVRLLNTGKDDFITGARDVLRAGLSSAAWLEPPACIAGLDDIAMARQPVQHGGRHLGIAEHLRPIREGEIGGDQQRCVFVELADQVE